MAERAGARGTAEIPGASHVIGISHPDETTQLVRDPAQTAGTEKWLIAMNGRRAQFIVHTR